MKVVSMQESLFVAGHTACAGCGAVMAIHQMLRALGKDIIVVNPTGCMEIVASKYPESSWKVPYIHSLFENAAAVASGIAACLRAKGNEHTQVVVFAGDGSTYDIGFGFLSGALERNDDVLHICYTNEAYMNTGVQRSGATPLHAKTTTSQVGSKVKGKEVEMKSIVEIVAAHKIPYAASCSIAFPADFELKLKKASKLKGARFLVVQAPCVPGWGYKENLTVELAKLAVETGAWQLYEIENGKLKINYKPKFKPLIEYLKHQARFKHLLKPENKFLLEELEKSINNRWQELLKLERLE